MAPATKRKNEEDNFIESKPSTSKDAKSKRKPVMLSSIQFDRSFKLLEKKFKEDASSKVAPRLDVPRRRTSIDKQICNTDQAANPSDIIDISQDPNDEMEGDWFEPKKTQKPSQAPNSNTTVEHANRYEILDTQPNEPNQTSDTQSTNKNKTHKPPPITVHNSTIKTIILLLNKYELGKEPIRLRQINGLDNTINIQADNLDNYNKTIQALKAEQSEFYTYTPKSAKIKSIVLKGVKGDFSEENILEALLSCEMGAS
ncbi:hypothetical protein PV326_002840 [Microctonus aethiopoides]|nr:hypothetical protein PV326_002840 [Microctonus aethiopoides]